MRTLLILLLLAVPIAAQNSDQCEINVADLQGSGTRALGKFETVIGEEERTVRAFRLPGTKQFVVASVFYPDESMVTKRGSSSTFLELTLSPTPRRRILRSTNFAGAEFPTQVAVGRVSLRRRAAGKPQLIVMECRRIPGSVKAKFEPETISTSANGLKRMYVLDCGRLIAKDQSRWTPGVNAGKPRELSNNCYLLQHERGTLLWETGVPDSVVEKKEGVTSPNGAVVWFRDKTLESQLASLGIKRDDITYVAISHTHGDHVGNAKLFMTSKVLIQKLEYESAMTGTRGPLGDDQSVEMLSGDRDVFGDGSVTIISTPGHTPGHQSLLVKLPKSGAFILTGDLVHFQYMWDHKIVPAFNFNKEQSVASIERIAQLKVEHRARLWIGHDKDITAKVKRAPKFYE